MLLKSTAVVAACYVVCRFAVEPWIKNKILDSDRQQAPKYIVLLGFVEAIGGVFLISICAALLVSLHLIDNLDLLSFYSYSPLKNPIALFFAAGLLASILIAVSVMQRRASFQKKLEKAHAPLIGALVSKAKAGSLPPLALNEELENIVREAREIERSIEDKLTSRGSPKVDKEIQNLLAVREKCIAKYANRDLERRIDKLEVPPSIILDPNVRACFLQRISVFWPQGLVSNFRSARLTMFVAMSYIFAATMLGGLLSLRKENLLTVEIDLRSFWQSIPKSAAGVTHLAIYGLTSLGSLTEGWRPPMAALKKKGVETKAYNTEKPAHRTKVPAGHLARVQDVAERVSQAEKAKSASETAAREAAELEAQKARERLSRVRNEKEKAERALSEALARYTAEHKKRKAAELAAQEVQQRLAHAQDEKDQALREATAQHSADLAELEAAKKAAFARAQSSTGPRSITIPEKYSDMAKGLQTEPEVRQWPTTETAPISLLTLSRNLLALGKISEARQVLESAAAVGSASAALALGTTFDPKSLAQINADHEWADPEKARQWYRRAFKLEQKTRKHRAGDRSAEQ